MNIEIGNETQTEIIIKNHPFGKGLKELCGLDETIQMHNYIIACERIELKKHLTFHIWHDRRLGSDNIKEIFQAELESILVCSKEELQKGIDKINKQIVKLENGN